MALKQIKNRILATKKTGQVTKAMEAVSAVKMRKSQERAISGKAYAESALRILKHVSGSRDIQSSLSQKDGDGRVCFVVITSDKGLAGSLSSAVIKNTMRELASYAKEEVRIIAFGRKAVEHFKREGYALDEEYTNISDDVSLPDMEGLIASVLDRFQNGEYRDIFLAYQNFISTFEQHAVVRKILPLDRVVLEEMVRDIAPRTGAYSEKDTEVSDSVSDIYTIEPSPEEVLATLIPQLVSIMVYHAMLEHKASEHSARMVAMKNATDNAKEQVKLLTLKFNRARQAVITAEVSEITGGIEAMKE